MNLAKSFAWMMKGLMVRNTIENKVYLYMEIYLYDS